MNLLQRLTEDMKSAMRSGDKQRLQVIRMLLSEVKNIDLQPNKATELQAVEGYHKKLKKSLEEYEKLGKPNEANALRFEISVVEGYLPAKLGEAETRLLVEQFLAGKGFTEKQSGQATGQFLKAHGGQVDAAVVSRLVRELLSGK